MRSLSAALFALLVVLSGCSLIGDAENGSSGTLSNGPSQDLAFDDDSAPPTVAPELRDRGGVLRLGVAATTWHDPALIDEAREGEQHLADLLFDGLTILDESGAIGPAIAATWTANGDATEWTFDLAADAEFSDGSSVEPGDVKYSIERVAALGVQSLAGHQLRHLDEVEALDTSVVLRLQEPFAALPRLLASPIFGIVPAGSGESTGLPVSSGSLEVVSASSDVIDLAPVDATVGYVEGITIQLFDTDTAVVEAFDEGLLDVASVSQSADVAEPEQSEEQGVESVERRVLKGLDTSFFLMNLGNEAFADPLIRQAIVLAVDSQFIASGITGVAFPLEGLLPSSSQAWRPGVCDQCPYQPDKAREIIGSFGADEVPLIHVDHLDDPQSESVAMAVVDDLNYVGFDARARPHTAQAFAAKAAAGELSLFHYGMFGSWASPEAYLGSLFATDGADNVTSFSDPEVDRLLEEAARTQDDAARITLYQQVEERILSFSVAIPLFERERLWLIAPGINNVRNAGLGSLNPDVVWISAE